MQLSCAVPHVAQRFSWDCGLACVEMVLRALGDETSPAKLHAQAGTASVWTIDLAFLLAAHCVPCTYRTSQLGCNPNFAREGFYAERLRDDRERVERLFSRALASGTPCVEHRAVSRDELCLHLGGGSAVAIVLVDRQRLCGTEDGAAERGNAHASEGAHAAGDRPAGAAAATGRLLVQTLGTLVPSALRPSSGAQPASDAPRLAAGGVGGFTGHYLVLVGVSTDSPAYLALDPARERGPVAVPFAELDRARGAFGTDDDVLLVCDERLPKQIVTQSP
ncbi:hypothetical protein KFE25_000438 [Diacronema lutheri]|uniref:Guanylyl cyclase n=1 Tax=Diacronema lutheri TaxID=2081491 RepID=A0A8J6CA22_DIALT|nr:hypothetical protein KFE25_000438 [Diacronema lutheri]